VATSGNTTDVVAEFMKACREEGVKPGIYYCVLDGHNEGGVKWKAAVSDAYFALIRRQIAELHTRYPGITEQWIDIPGKLSRDQRWDLYRTIKKHNPDCLILMNQSFSKGVNVPPGSWPTDLLNGEMTLPPEPRHDPRKTIEGKSYYLPMEVCDVISSKKKWFWQPNDPPKPVKDLYRLYRQTVDRGANLLLNVPPDRTGRIPAEYAAALVELKKVIDDPSRLPP
jgi:alpha-L-fucosidase